MSRRPFDEVDSFCLQRACDIARNGRYLTRPNPMVGAVLARPASGDDIPMLAEGWHEAYGSLHAEAACLQNFGSGRIPSDATMYVSLEPCAHHGRQPPCVDALIARGVRRVVIGCVDPNPETCGQGPAKLIASGVEVVWAPPAEANAAAMINPGFQRDFRDDRPWVIAKWAMTATGRFATGNPDSRWITGPAARHEVHLQRARSGAVAVGVGTVIDDDPLLTVRDVDDLDARFQQPLRVIFDRDLSSPLSSRVIADTSSAPTLVVAIARNRNENQRPWVERRMQLTTHGAEVWEAPPACERSTEFLHEALAELAQRSVRTLYLEAGPRLLQAFFDAGLIDQIECFVGAAAAAADQPGLPITGDLCQLALAAPARELDGDRWHSAVIQPIAALRPNHLTTHN